jgi:hypothetical protein
LDIILLFKCLLLGSYISYHSRPHAMKNIISRPSKEADVEDLLWARAAPGPEEFAGLESRERA